MSIEHNQQLITGGKRDKKQIQFTAFWRAMNNYH